MGVFDFLSSKNQKQQQADPVVREQEPPVSSGEPYNGIGATPGGSEPYNGIGATPSHAQPLETNNSTQQKDTKAVEPVTQDINKQELHILKTLLALRESIFIFSPSGIFAFFIIFNSSI